MSNSFYYFFSATPQVLSAILALFGVFVVFKIQTIKTNLTGIGITLLNRLNRLSVKQTSNFKINDDVSFRQFKRTVENAVKRNDIKALITNIDYIANKNYKFYSRNIHKLNDFLKTLIDKTIFWSKITAIIIIVCLAVIPFGDIILKHSIILQALFGIITICMIIIFYNFISILIMSLNDPNLE